MFTANFDAQYSFLNFSDVEKVSECFFLNCTFSNDFPVHPNLPCLQAYLQEEVNLLTRLMMKRRARLHQLGDLH